MSKLRIGYVPEHFSTPLAFAQRHYGLDADFEPVPTGTGTLAARLKGQSGEEPLDVAVGLTEGFVADLGKAHATGSDAGYSLVGNFVASPLKWAIVVGNGRDDINNLEDLKGRRVAVSRIGSGSYVMSFVLADQRGWLDPSSSNDSFEVVPIGDFAALRKAVNEGKADFFMWEHFTTRKFWENGEVKYVGDIETPWPSWVIAARNTATSFMPEVMEKINKGIEHFKQHPEEAIEYITSTMHYGKADAEEWMKTVRFPDDVHGVPQSMVRNTVDILKKAGVLKDKSVSPQSMISIEQKSG